MKKYVSEFVGTLVLVFVGCGTAVVSNGNLVATSLAFGLSVMAMAYSVGSVSGGHFNPAITLGMLMDKRIKGVEALKYMLAQVLGALCGSIILYAILSGSALADAGLGANGYGEASAIGIGLFAALVVEIVLTCIFVYTAMCVSKDKDFKGAGLIIGLTLTLVHLIGIGLTGTSVNPARSLAPAILLMGTAIKQVWVFIVGPFIGACFAGLLYLALNKKTRK